MGRSGGRKSVRKTPVARITISGNLVKGGDKNTLPLPNPSVKTKLSSKNRSQFLKKIYKQTEGLDSHCEVKKEGIFTIDDAYEFAERLRFYHEIASSHVDKETFENMLVATKSDLGASVKTPGRANYPGADIEVEKIPYSVKTESGSSIQFDKIRVSKLMEASWAKGLKKKSDAVQLLPKVVDHLSRYKKIVILRSFDDKPIVYYQLYEIPKKMLIEGIESLELKDFQTISPKTGSTRATIKNKDGKEMFDLVFDGSAGKIGLRRIDSEECDLQVEWWVEARESFFKND